MMMKATTRSRVDLQEFLEIVLMWHCSGDIPMDRVATIEFIERLEFSEFLMSVQHWSSRFGVKPPSRSEIVRTLHQLY
jgi:hypothetical protein